MSQPPIMHVLLISLVMIFVIYPVNCYSYCPVGCTCDDETLIVKCDEGHLDVLPIALNPSIQRLVIKNNKVKTIDSSIQFYSELTFLDLSQNHLFNIPQKTFFYQKKLEELHLNHNKIGSVDNKTFIGLNSLVVLNLRGNFIDEIKGNVFSMLSGLEELNLGQNRISQIDSNAFSGLTNLKILYLDDNTLTSVPSPTFRMISSLAELYLGMNAFKIIPRGAFSDLVELNKLDVRGAGLHNISHESLRGLENLRILDISDNRLRRIPTVELSTLKRLEELSLGQNNFDVVAEKAFVGLTNLKKLYIVGAYSLKTIENGAFVANTNLESITISSNKMLSEIEDGALSGLPYLKHVVLKGNSLTTFTEGLMSWNDLHSIDISENPIYCDCRVFWLRNLLSTKNFSNEDASNILCDSPSRLKGESLKTLSSSLLGCNYNESRRRTMIGALLVGVVAVITAVTLIVCRCRRNIHELFKKKWNNNALEEKEREYQKTFSDDEYKSCYYNPYGFGPYPVTNNSNNYSYNNNFVNVRPLPVTEL